MQLFDVRFRARTRFIEQNGMRPRRAGRPFCDRVLHVQNFSGTNLRPFIVTWSS
jgi:hypothetical protein